VNDIVETEVEKNLGKKWFFGLSRIEKKLREKMNLFSRAILME